MDPVLTMVRSLLDLILAFVPHDVAKAELDEAAIRRANAIADAAENVKFHGTTP